MPLKLSVGLSRKQGLPHFGSAGASCQVEVELPADAIREPQSFLSEAERALDACRQVVETELARQTQPLSTTSPPVSQAPSNQAPVTPPATQASAAADTAAASSFPLPLAPSAASTAYRERPADRPATPRQLQAIERLVLRIGANPAQWLHERIGDTPPHCLSVAEASALIDELQQQLPTRMAG